MPMGMIVVVVVPMMTVVMMVVEVHRWLYENNRFRDEPFALMNIPFLPAVKASMTSLPIRRFSREEILEMDRFFRTTFMNSLSGFKSVNLVGTTSSSGVHNLAIFNSIVHIGANPPFLGMVVRPHTVPRDTLENILATQHFTLNHIHRDIYPQAHQTAARYPADTSEFEAVGLTALETDFPAPYVAEARLRIGMKFEERHDIMNGTILVVGSVQEVLLPDSVVGEEGYVDLSELGSLTVAGLDAYHETKLVDRLAYAKPDKAPKSIL